MLKNITLGQYIVGNSVIHRIDPRIKIINTLILVITLFMVSTFTGFGIYLFLIFLIIKISGISIKKVLKGLKPIIFLVMITLFLHIFFTREGRILWEWRFITIAEGGIYRGFFMVSRILLLIMYTTLLTLTTSPLELTDGIEYILSPFKKIGIPAGELAMMMTIALRFIPTLLEEAQKIMKAQKARGADLESGNIIERAKNLIPLLVPLFLSAFRRADELALAMEARCYQGGIERTRLHELQLEKRDIFALLFIVILAVVVSFY